jgi:hypothetical protein
MHDGSVKTLCAAVLPHALLSGIDGAPDHSPPILDAAERSAVVAFLRTLSGNPNVWSDHVSERCS